MWIFISLCRFGEFSIIITLSNYFKQFYVFLGFFFLFFFKELSTTCIHQINGILQILWGFFHPFRQLHFDLFLPLTTFKWLACASSLFFLSLFQYNYFPSSFDSFINLRLFLHPKFQYFVAVMISALILICLAYCFPNFIRCLCLSFCSSLSWRSYWIISQAVCNSISFGSVTIVLIYFLNDVMFLWLICEFYGFVAVFPSIK